MSRICRSAVISNRTSLPPNKSRAAHYPHSPRSAKSATGLRFPPKRRRRPPSDLVARIFRARAFSALNSNNKNIIYALCPKVIIVNCFVGWPYMRFGASALTSAVGCCHDLKNGKPILARKRNGNRIAARAALFARSKIVVRFFRRRFCLVRKSVTLAMDAIKSKQLTNLARK